MFKNFFKLSLRSMARNKVHALINVAGLSLGLVGALVIFMIIRYELSFDAHHREADRIFRLVRTSHEFGQSMHTPGVPYPLPQALRTDFQEIERIAIVDANFTPSVFAIKRDDGTIAKFKEEKGMGIFILALLAGFGIVLLTIGYKSAAAALANPVEALRYE